MDDINNEKKLLNKVSEIYRKNLSSADGSEAVEYLKNRKISPETARKYSLGYAKKANDITANFKNTVDYNIIKQHFLSLKGKYSQYDKFRDRIMFPIQNENGDVIAFGGRLMSKSDKAAKYINSSTTPTFNKSHELYGFHQAKEEIKAQGACVVVEGYLDVLSMHQNVIGAVVAPMGTSLTEHHAKKIFSLVDYIYLCFDGDKAGQAATLRTIKKLAPLLASDEDKDLRIVQMPEGKDPDDTINDKGPYYFKSLLRKAKTPEDYITSIAKKEWERSSQLLARFVNEWKPYYQPQSKHRQDRFIIAVARESGFKESTIREGFNVPIVQKYKTNAPYG